MKKYFVDIIKNTLENTPDNAKRVTALLNEKTIDFYPKFLYKYRSCDKEHNFEMLEQEYVWADYPKEFDDPFDAIVNLRLKAELNEIEKWIYQHLGELIYYKIPPEGMEPIKHGQKLSKYIEAQKGFVVNGKLNSKRIIAAQQTELSKLPANQRQNMIQYYKSFEKPEFRNFIEENAKKALYDNVNILREQAQVVCLTTRNNNQKMWEDYSAKYSGFVIQYNRPKYEDINEEEKELIIQLLPVSYYKQIPRVSVLPILKYIYQHKLYGITSEIPYEMVTWFCQMLYKKKEYSSEEEWRIITGSNEHKIQFPYVSAVYAGYKINKDNLERLEDICRNKGIALYKQELDKYNGMLYFKRILEGDRDA